MRDRTKFANEVAARLCGVIDLPAADAQYHVPCYDKFRVVPVSRPPMMAPVEEALRSMVTTMAENMTETWMTSELYSMYLATSGTVKKTVCIQHHSLLWRQTTSTSHREL